jgi:hypothetical protein
MDEAIDGLTTPRLVLAQATPVLIAAELKTADSPNC